MLLALDISYTIKKSAERLQLFLKEKSHNNTPSAVFKYVPTVCEIESELHSEDALNTGTSTVVF